MEELSLRTFSYGHFNSAQYDEETQSWIFSRRMGKKHLVYALGNLENIVDGVQGAFETPDFLSNRDHLRYINELAWVHPELRGIYLPLAPDIVTSWAALASMKTYDPAVGDLLGLGFVERKRRHGISTIPVYASPGGGSGWGLRIAEANYATCQFRTHFPRDESPKYIVRKTTGEIGSWSASGYSVRQVAFSLANSDSVRSQLIAIRFPASTTIFLVKRRLHKVPQAGYVPQTMQPYTNFTFQIYQEIVFCTQNGVHADIAFNPWRHRQLAVIDRLGRWAVFNLVKDRPNSKHRRPLPAFFGRIEPIPSLEEDGWAMIRFVNNADTIVCCTRTCLQLSHLRPIPEHHEISNLKSLLNRDTWILDLRVGDRNRSDIFVLTISKIFWLKVVTEDSRAKAVLLLEIRHFRNPMDATMRVKVVESGIVSMAFIHSRLSPIVSCYGLSFADTNKAIPSLVSDPSKIDFSHMASGSGLASTTIVDLHVQHLRRKSHHHESTHNSQSFVERFFEVTVLCDDFSIWRTFLYCNPDKRLESLPKPALKQHAIKKIPRIGSFAVPDAMVRLSDRSHVEFELDDHHTTILNRKENLSEKRSITMATVYNQIKNLCMPICSHYTTVNDMKAKDLTEFLNTVRKIVDISRSSYKKTATTLFELMHEPHDIEVLGKAFDDFDKFLNSYSENFQAMENCLTGILRTLAPLSLRENYTKLVAAFVSCLSKSASPHFRRSRRNIVQSIAAEICLATIPIYTFPPTDKGKGRVWPAPGQPSQAQSLRPSLLAPTQQSNITSSSPTLQESSYNPLLAPLQKYVRSRKPFQAPKQKTLRNLTHWEFGANPKYYNYLSHAVADRDAKQMAQLTDAERQEIQRKAQKQAERQAVESQRYSQMVSQATEAVSDSQLVGGTGQTLRDALLRRGAVSQLQAQSQKEAIIDGREVGQAQEETQMQTQTQEVATSQISVRTKKKARKKGF